MNFYHGYPNYSVPIFLSTVQTNIEVNNMIYLNMSYILFC